MVPFTGLVPAIGSLRQVIAVAVLDVVPRLVQRLVVEEHDQVALALIVSSIGVSNNRKSISARLMIALSVFLARLLGV